MSTAEPRFFFGAMSPYSWFAAERIDQLLPEAHWSGVMAGGLFKANDRVSWGLTHHRQAGMADCEQRAEVQGLGPIRWPKPWPTSDLLVARAITHADMQGVCRPYAMAAMRLAFLEGADLGKRAAVLEAARRARVDTVAMDEAIDSPAVKQRLRSLTDEAVALGVFGVPTVLIDGTLYWGDDRLEQAREALHGPGAG